MENRKIQFVRYCRKIGHTIQECCKLTRKTTATATIKSSSISPTLSATDIEAIVNKVSYCISLHSAFIIPDMSSNTTWLLDSTCANYMTTNSLKYSFRTPAFNIHTTNGSTI